MITQPDSLLTLTSIQEPILKPEPVPKQKPLLTLLPNLKHKHKPWPISRLNLKLMLPLLLAFRLNFRRVAQPVVVTWEVTWEVTWVVV